MAVPVTIIDSENPERETGAEWFARQDATTQVTILGQTRYQLYKDGKITLADVVDRHPSPWGPTAGIKSLQAMGQDLHLTRDIVAVARQGWLEAKRAFSLKPRGTKVARLWYYPRRTR